MSRLNPSSASAQAGSSGDLAQFKIISLLQNTPHAVRELVAGGVAGGTAKTCVAPLERCKILFQTGKLSGGKVSTTLRNIMALEGPRGLFVGNGVSVLRIVPYASIHFGLYEYYRRLLVLSVYSNDTGDSHGNVTPFIDLLAGSSAGASAVIATYPLDLVRTRLAYMTEGQSRQMQNNINSGKSSVRVKHTIRSVMADTLRREGLRGMYRGIGPSLYGILPYAGLKFYVYQHMKQFYVKTFNILPRTVILSDDDDDSTSSSSSNVVDHDATHELAIGKDPTLKKSPSVVVAPSGRQQSAEHVKTRLPVPVMLGFGAFAGLIAQTVTYPLDVVRRRMQVEGLQELKQQAAQSSSSVPSAAAAGRVLPRHTLVALVAIARQYGWRTLYSGLTINYMKVVPSTAIGFTIYDYLKSALNLPNNF